MRSQLKLHGYKRDSWEPDTVFFTLGVLHAQTVSPKIRQSIASVAPKNDVKTVGGTRLRCIYVHPCLEDWG